MGVSLIYILLEMKAYSSTSALSVAVCTHKTGHQEKRINLDNMANCRGTPVLFGHQILMRENPERSETKKAESVGEIDEEVTGAFLLSACKEIPVLPPSNQDTIIIE